MERSLEKKIETVVENGLKKLIHQLKELTVDDPLSGVWPNTPQLPVLIDEFLDHIQPFNTSHHGQEFKMILLDAFSTFLDSYVLENRQEKYYAIYILIQLSNILCQQQVIRFGDYVDCFSNILERCTLTEAADLCDLLCDQKDFLKCLLEKEKCSALRIARARLLSLVNAFERKLFVGIDNDKMILTRLRSLCFDLLPINFQGLCNKGIREAPGRHFILKSAKILTTHPPQPKAVDFTERHVSSDSDLVPDMTRNESLVGKEEDKSVRQQKRRRVADVASSAVDLESDVDYIYNHWELILTFFTNPAVFILSSVVEEVDRCFSTLSRMVKILSEKLHDIWDHQPVKRPESNSFLPFIEHKRKTPALTLCCMEPFNQSGHTAMDCTTKNAYVLPLIEKGSPLSFQQAWRSMPFRRCLLMCLVSVFRFMYLKKYSMKPQSVSQNGSSATSPEDLMSLADLLASPLVGHKALPCQVLFHRTRNQVTTLNTLKENLVKLLIVSPSCFRGVPPSRVQGIRWFAICPLFRPPSTLAQLVRELTDQESLFNVWKKNSCPDRSSVEGDEPTKETPPLCDPHKIVPETLLRHGPALCSKVFRSAVSLDDSSSPHKLQQRQKNYLTNFLPILAQLDHEQEDDAEYEESMNTHHTSSTKLRVIDCDDLLPPSFHRERAEWCLSPSNENVFSRTVSLGMIMELVQYRTVQATVPMKLIEKWNDYKEKVISDDDVANQIEASEKVVKDSVFQWRCDRLLGFTNLQLYDYSNQNRELRVKIREANLEDLIRAAIQRETKLVHPVASK